MTLRAIPGALTTTRVARASGPSRYGLTRRETLAELRRLAAAGFQLWELRQLFGPPGDRGARWR